MGSELQLVSEPNIGSTFFFDLALTAQQVKSDELFDISKIEHALIVDDNANNRILVSDMLALKDVKSVAVESGKMALELLEAPNDFDLVLMDFNMTEIDGIETIRQIRNRLKLGPDKLPIILLHSSADDEYIIEAGKELGLVGRLVKPILMQSLYECISKSGLPHIQESTNASTYINYKHLKVLLADDNEFNILLVKQMITNMLPNAEIFEAIDGLKAIELFELHHPDLVFMDIQMPELNGHEASQKIRSLSNGKHIPIIALTAGTHEDEREKCMQAGMDDFITKPFVIETLEAVIAKWVSN